MIHCTWKEWKMLESELCLTEESPLESTGESDGKLPCSHPCKFMFLALSLHTQASHWDGGLSL